MDYAKKHGYLHPQFFVDDGVSGTTFNRPDFQRMQRMVENGEVGAIIVKMFPVSVVSKWKWAD